MLFLMNESKGDNIMNSKRCFGLKKGGAVLQVRKTDKPADRLGDRFRFTSDSGDES